MKEIPLTRGKVALIDDEDFESVSRFKWHVTHGYARTVVHLGMVNGKRIQAYMYLHILILRPPKGMEVDHRYHDTLDCRRVNMRVCTRSQNQQNKVKYKGSSKYKGVYWHTARDSWQTQIKHNGRTTYLGRFSDEADAAHVYDTKAREYFGEFAYLNFP